MTGVFRNVTGDPVGGRVLVVAPCGSGPDSDGGSFVRGGDASGIDSDGNGSAAADGHTVPEDGSEDGAPVGDGESNGSGVDAADRTDGGSAEPPGSSSEEGGGHDRGCDPETVADGISDRLPVDVVIRDERTAGEYLDELGPTIDCVVVLGSETGPVGDPDNDVSIPAIVCEGPIVERDPSQPLALDEVAGRVQAVVREARTRSDLQDQNTRLAALSRYAGDITGCKTVDAVLERTVEAATDALAFDYCVILLSEGDRLVPRASALPDPDLSPCGVDEGIAGRTLAAGEAEMVTDLQSDPDAIPEHDDLHALLSVPIGSRGVLQITSRSRDAFDERDKEFAEILSGYTREALERLEREVTLRAERDRLHGFYTAVPVPVVCVECQDGESVVADVNAAYTDRFEEHPVGRPLSDVIPTEVERERYEAALKTGTISQGTFVRTTADGSDRTMALTVIPVSPPGGPDYAFGVYRMESPTSGTT